MNKFIFIPGLDQINNDIFHSQNKLEDLFNIAINNHDIEGFNSLGFFKHKIDKLEPSKYFNKDQGIYIKKKNCYICGCVKNNEKYLYQIFNNIRHLITLFDNYKVIIAYDESYDNSLKILHEMKNEFNLEIIMCNNKNPISCINISNARNSVLDYIRSLNENYEYFIVMDMDNVCANLINLNVIRDTIVCPDWDAITFNRPDYYDIFALSIDPYFISWQSWYPDSGKVGDIMKDYIINKLNKLKDTDNLLECYSAFNGFMIYKTSKFINNNYGTDLSYNMKLLTNNNIENNIKILKNFKINLNNNLDCEHKQFHYQAINRYNARIRISPKYCFIFNQ